MSFRLASFLSLQKYRKFCGATMIKRVGLASQIKPLPHVVYHRPEKVYQKEPMNRPSELVWNNVADLQVALGCAKARNPTPIKQVHSELDD